LHCWQGPDPKRIPPTLWRCNKRQDDLKDHWPRRQHNGIEWAIPIIVVGALAQGCRLVGDEYVDELTGELIERMVSVEVRIR